MKLIRRMDGKYYMKLLYISQFYYPERAAAAFRAYENSKYWAGEGHNVTIFTGNPNFPTGNLFAGYANKLIDVETKEGVKIIRNKVFARKNTNIFNRLICYLSFPFFGTLNMLFNRKKIGQDYNVILATTGTIFAPFLGILYSKILKKPLIVEFRDITYSQMVANGKSKSSLAYKIVRRIELLFCKHAKHIVTVTKGFQKELVQEGIPKEKISVIYNGVKIEENDYKTVKDHSKQEVTIGYFGALGKSQNLQFIIDVFNKIQVSGMQVNMVFIGDGAEKETLNEYIKNNKISNIKMMDNMEKSQLDTYYEKCDFLIVSLKNNKAFKNTVPSKIFHIMGKAKPIIYFGPIGEASNIIEEAKSGIIVNTVKVEEAQKIVHDSLKKNVDEIKNMGSAGYEFVKVKFDREYLAEKYIEIIKKVSSQ